MRLHPLAVFLVAAMICLSPVAIVSCSTSQQTAAYKTSGVTHASVKAAMHGWNLYVQSGKASIKDEQKVKAAYQKYQTTQLALINAVQQFTIVPDAAAQDKLNAEISAAAAALSELMGLLNQFGVVK